MRDNYVFMPEIFLIFFFLEPQQHSSGLYLPSAGLHCLVQPVILKPVDTAVNATLCSFETNPREVSPLEFWDWTRRCQYCFKSEFLCQMWNLLTYIVIRLFMFVFARPRVLILTLNSCLVKMFVHWSDWGRRTNVWFIPYIFAHILRLTNY